MCAERNDIVTELQEALSSSEGHKGGISSSALDCKAAHRGMAVIYLVKTNSLNCGVYGDAPAL